MNDYVIEWRRKVGMTIHVGMNNVTAESEEVAVSQFKTEKAATDKIGEYEIIRIYPEE